MPFALVHSLSAKGKRQPLFAQGVNTENSFYTDGPSITAAAGFVNMLCELEPMRYTMKGKNKLGIKNKGFSLFIHSYERSEGKVAFNSGTANYVPTLDKLINPPVPVEIFTADISFSIIIEYEGRLPGNQEQLDLVLNCQTRRFNGGTILDDLMISPIDDDEMRDYFTFHKANQILDRSDLNITDWNTLLEYIAFYENPETKKRDLKRHNGVFYAHQTGFQLLEEPCEREGALLNQNDVCQHAYCEPIINLAELQHTTHLQSLNDLSLWHWQENTETRTVILTTK